MSHVVDFFLTLWYNPYIMYEIIPETEGGYGMYSGKDGFTAEELKYLQLLSKQYQNINSAATEVMNLKAILNLPKGT